MAEVFVGPLSEVLIDKVISIASEKIGRVFGVKDDFKRLQETLSNIQAVLNDAERRQVEESGAIKKWLMKLKEVVYDIEDIVDEFEYEALRRKLEIQGRFLKKVRNLFLPSNPLAFRFKMSRKIKQVNQTLDEITKDKERFQFASTNTISGFKRGEGRETYAHLADPNDVVGRDPEKSEVIDRLLDNNSGNNSVVRIVGIGGLGKTKLAQLIYNDKQVKDHFPKKMWVCVSNNNTKQAIFSNLLESIKQSRCDLKSLDAMVSSLKQALGSERYLMVLDDVWNDGSIDWGEMLTCLLSMGAEGSSKIIMTSRSDEDIPSVMNSIYNHRLGILPETECWSIFEKIAFGNGGAKKTQELIDIGMEIVKKCGGVPLAAKTLGGMMYSTSNEGEWLSIQKSDIWSLPEGQEKITHVLKLSYDHLSSQVQRCFSYCSIFPKDHKIGKEKLIQLWMAEGFLNPSNKNEALRNVGKNYLNILLRNCFLEDGHTTLVGEKAYKMHDLVHDLALSVVGSEYSMSDDWMIEDKEIDRLRHVQLVSNYGVSSLPQAIYEAKKLRTFICIKNYWSKLNIPESVWDRMFLKLNYLRVMDLSRCKMKELPPSIGKLKHLRYIDLTWTNLTRLPDSFTSLYNLQTLIIQGCCEFKELPKDMKKLTNLRHLIIGDSGLSQMPRELGKLSLLEKLSYFIVGKDKGYGIEELKDLNLLGGRIEISCLENVRNGEDALRANLKEKQNIHELKFKWTDNPFIIEDDQYYEVLQGLQPHRNLKRLNIERYGASKFPTWIMSISHHLPNLVSLTLWRCPKCEYLPSVGQLPCLQLLRVEDLEAVKRIGNEFYRSSNNEDEAEGSFRCLKVLTLKNMPHLEEWSEDKMSSSSSFPCLEKLKIVGYGASKFPTWIMSYHLPNLVSLTLYNCPKCEYLPSVGQLPCLQLLRVEDLEAVKRIGNEFYRSSNNEDEAEGSFPCLKELTLENMPNLEEWSEDKMSSSFPCLEKLVIKKCSKLITTPTLFPSLKKLELNEGNGVILTPLLTSNQASLVVIRIRECLELIFLPESLLFGKNNVLERLEIRDCKKFEGFLIPNQLEEELQLSNTSSLKSLWIENCAVLKYIPNLRGLNSLQKLSIQYCGSLKSLPDGLQCLTALEVLFIGEFSEELNSFPFPPIITNDQCFVSLRTLHILGWPGLKSLPDQLQHLVLLQELQIWNFPSLEALPEWLGNLASLRELWLYECKNLMYLPSKEQMLRFTSLQELVLLNCPLLKERCSGDEKHKIAHIPKITYGSAN